MMEIAGSEPDVILISEVIPKAQVLPLSLSLFYIRGYKAYFNFDPSCHHLGLKGIRGVCIFVKDRLRCVPFASPSSKVIEALWLSVSLQGNDTLLLGCVYRSPSSCLEVGTAEICNMLKCVYESAATHILITGDFNFPNIDWETASSQYPESHPSNLFLETLHDCFFTQHIKKPTRYRYGSHPSILDLIISNEEGIVNNIEFLPGLGSSDHIILRFDIVCYTQPWHVMSTKRPAYYKADFDSLRQHAAQMQWGHPNSLEVQEAYSVFQQRVAKLVDEHVPKSRPGRQKNLYMDRSALRLRKHKRAQWAAYIQSDSVHDFRRYVHFRNQLRKKTRHLRKEFELRLSSQLKSNPKVFWRYANTRLKTKGGIDALKDAMGVVRSSPMDKANILNDFFSSVFVEENLDTLPETLPRQEEANLPDVTVTVAEVLKKLDSLKISSAPGPDGMHPRVLHELRHQVALPLTEIFRKSLSSSVLPLQWRQASIIPIYKKGDKQLPSNYRPVSLTSIVCKMLESVLRDKIMQHLETFNLLSPHQHGFRSARSCTSQLLEVMDSWTQALDRGQSMDAIYLDFQKAFDSVPHARLLQKLQAYGIRGNVLRWIESFLTCRTQQVLVEGVCSRWSSVRSGVPQGSVLGPLLFLLYINDIPDDLQTCVKIFADDSKLYGPADTQQSRQLLQRDLQTLESWSIRWQLPFNVSKCKVLHMGSRNPHCTYTMFGNSLASTEQERDLGVLVDGALRFHNQAAAAAAKGNQILGVVRRSFASLSKTSLTLLFKSLIRPHLEYGNGIWGPVSKGDQKLIEKVQRRATKLVPEIRAKPYADRLKELGLPSLSYRRLRGDMILTYQILRGNLDVDRTLLSLSTTRHTRGHEFKLDIHRARSLPRRHFFSVRSAAHWNSLPSAVVTAPTISTFKSRLDSHWKDLHYVSIFDE